MNTIIDTLMKWAEEQGIPTGNLESEASEFDTGMTYSYPAPLYTVQCAMHPRDRGISHGHTHIVFSAEYHNGRIHRHPGQALCTTRQFWGWSGTGGDMPTCPKCAEMTRRYGLC